MLYKRRCCRKGPFGSDFGAIVAIATSLVVITIYYMSPSVEKVNEKTDFSRTQQNRISETNSKAEKVKLQQQIDDIDEA